MTLDTLRDAMDKAGATTIVYEMEQALKRKFGWLQREIPHDEFELDLIGDIQNNLDDELYTDAAEGLIELEGKISSYQDSDDALAEQYHEMEVERRIDEMMEAR